MENTQVKNAVVWFDIPTADFDRALKFYSDILGEPITVTEMQGQKMGMFPMQGQGVGGDLIPPSPDFKPSSTGTRVWLNVSGRLDQALSIVEKAGGKVLEPKFQMPEIGWMAVIMDSEGNNVGLFSDS